MKSEIYLKPLSGGGKQITYKDTPDGKEILWGNLRFKIPNTMIDDILNYYFADPDKWYPLGASFDTPIKGGLGEYIQNNHKGYTPRHASAVVAIMVNEDLLTCRGKKPIELKPGQMAYFNKKSKETTVSEVDVEPYILWIQGLFSFSNTDFNRITKKLERYYDINFQYDDPMKGTIQITGKLDVTQEREEVFGYLEKLTGLDFIKVTDKQYVIK